MLLVRVQVDEYVLVQHNRVVAHWTASTVWGSAVKKLLERLDFRVDEVDATSMVESFRQFGDRDSIDWDPPALIQEVLEEFGVEDLGRPLDHDQAAHLWEKARVLGGFFLEKDVRLSEFLE